MHVKTVHRTWHLHRPNQTPVFFLCGSSKDVITLKGCHHSTVIPTQSSRTRFKPMQIWKTGKHQHLIALTNPATKISRHMQGAEFLRTARGNYWWSQHCNDNSLWKWTVPFIFDGNCMERYETTSEHTRCRFNTHRSMFQVMEAKSIQVFCFYEVGEIRRQSANKHIQVFHCPVLHRPK